MATGQITGQQFTQILIKQDPNWDREILRDIRPSNADLVGFYETGAFDAFTGVEHTFDRAKTVFPNVTAAWDRTATGSCIGTPCDFEYNRIGMGYERRSYFLEEQRWATDLFCFDQIMTANRAKESFSNLIDNTLRPATRWITTDYLMKRAADYAGKKWVASAALINAGTDDFTFTWDAGGYVYLNTSAEPTSKITPQMLQRRLDDQYLLGAIDASTDEFGTLQLQTDKETFRGLCQEDPYLKEMWRFSEFPMASKQYFKYGLRGQVGDFLVKVLHFPLRFDKVSTNRFQVVLPYKNVDVTEGIGAVPNPQYQKAQYQFSLINHRKALKVMPFKDGRVNPEMPFMTRDYGGKWQFVQNNLGADQNGRAIENMLMNKGKFVGEFKLAIKPERPEWLELIFHKREPACIADIAVCNPDPGYPAQVYTSSNDVCTPEALTFTPTQMSGGGYQINANTISCNDVPIVHAQVGSAGTLTLAALVSSLTTNAGTLGTWAVVSGSTTQIQLTGSTCSKVILPFVA